MSGFSSYIYLHKEITTPPVYSNFPEWAIRDVDEAGLLSKKSSNIK